MAVHGQGGVSDFPRLRAWASLKGRREDEDAMPPQIFPTPSGVGLIEGVTVTVAVSPVRAISHAFGRGPH